MKKINLSTLQKLAESILKMNEDTSPDELQQKAREIYEGLTVQLYLNKTSVEEAHFAEIELDVEKTQDEPSAAELPENREILAEPLIEKIKDIVAQMPEDTHHIDEMLEEILPNKKTAINDLEVFAATYQQTPVFERKETSEKEDDHKGETEPSEKSIKTDEPYKQKSLNDKLTKNIQIGLNDRLSLTKHLFLDNVSDYNRVVSQVTTLSSFDEARQFIMQQVKADYNWEGKEVYVERLLMLIEKRFD